VRYLLWVAALLTPRPPDLLVLNEPETSLHPDLLPPLARLILRAAAQSQVFVVSHASSLIDVLQQQPERHAIMLDKTYGETKAVAETGDERPAWRWPDR
jgi:predicted ATPase